MYVSNQLVSNQILTREAASGLSDFSSIMGLSGILIFGYLGDLLSKRHLLALALAIQSDSVLILLTADAAIQVYFFLLVFSLGSGMIPLALAIRADYFGRKAFATITVAMTLISGAIAGAMPGAYGFLVSQTYGGSGQLSVALLMLFGFIPAALFVFAKPPNSQRASNG
jgi:MFS family permease